MTADTHHNPGSPEERRSEERRPCQFAVRYRRLATPRLWEVDDHLFLEGKAVNVSPSGLCIETDCYIAPGQLLEVDLRPNGGSVFVGKLQAVRIARVTGSEIVFELQVGMVGDAGLLAKIYQELA